VFCVCEIIQLFYVVFYMVTVVNKFDYWDVTNEILNKLATNGKKAMNW
jgi:hypothetical protein